MLTFLCLALGMYALFTVFFYLISLRPRLRAREAAPVAGGALRTEAETAPPGVEASPGLQSALEEWQYTFDAIQDPVLILDNDLRVVKGNQAARRLLSVNGIPIDGKSCHQLFNGSDTVCPLCIAENVRLERKAQQRERTFRYLGRTFLVSCSPLLDQEQIVGFVFFAKDISLQRNLEKRLVHAHKLESIATLAGGIAHDFNNILGAILGNAELLLYRLPNAERPEQGSTSQPISAEEITEHVQSIRRAGHRAKELVTQILAFSRQSTNQRQNLLIAPVVRESCRLLRASLPATIELRVSVAEGIGMIYADAGQIQQVVMHLCTNAAQALEQQAGKIEVSLREAETGRAEQLR